MLLLPDIDLSFEISLVLFFPITICTLRLSILFSSSLDGFLVDVENTARPISPPPFVAGLIVAQR